MADYDDTQKKDLDTQGKEDTLKGKLKADKKAGAYAPAFLFIGD